MFRVIATALILTALPIAAISKEADKPEVLAVLFYADWCGSCKILDPEVTKARSEADLDRQPVVFVRLDLTDETTRYQAGLLASSLGLEEVYADYGSGTGFMLLVDADSKAVLATLRKSMDAAVIADQILGSIKAASSAT
ncbi:MAG: thioredoxin domain-containing protein [Woeseiaceae bacterium]|nr:thioredoxin domain-containing protein [Woeseiaceae bacterium]